MRSVEEGFGDGAGNIGPQLGHGLLGRDRQAREAEAGWLRCGRVFLRMIEGLVGLVVVDGPVVLMVVVLHALVVLKLMLELMGERCRAGSRRQAALHGETIQGQAQQEEDMDNPAQGSSR